MTLDISNVFGRSKQLAEQERANAARAAAGKLWCVPDDFPDLQSAIDGASAGDGIFIVPRDAPYVLRDPLGISKPLHILGVDDVGLSAVVRFETSDNYLPLLRIASNNVRIKGLTLEAVYVPTTTATASSLSGSTRASPRVASSSSTTFSSTAAASTTSTNNKQLQLAAAVPPPQFTLDPSAPRYVSVHVASGCQNVIFDECTIRGLNGMHGLFLGPDSYTSMVCCSVTSTTGCAVYSDGRLYVDRCDLVGSALGLMVSQSGCSNTQMKSSCFTNCDQGAVVDGHGYAHFNASVFSNCRVGLLVHSDLAVPKVSVVQGCEFVDCALSSIFISGIEAALDVQKSFFHGQGKHGIVVHHSSARVEIRANAFRGLSGTGVRVCAGSPVLECNVFESCGEAGIVVESCRCTIRLNEFVRNHKMAQTTAAAQSTSATAQGQQRITTGRLIVPSTTTTAPLTQDIIPHAARLQSSVALVVDGTLVSTHQVDSVHQSLWVEHVSIGGVVSSSGNQHHENSAAATAVLRNHANLVLAARSSIASHNYSTVNVLRPHPDPHVEGNLFAENDINAWIVLGSGTYVKNELLSSQEQSLVLEGAESAIPTTTTTSTSSPPGSPSRMSHSLRAGSPTTRSRVDFGTAVAGCDESTQKQQKQPRLPEFPASITHNELRGSVASHVIHCLPGAFATIVHNQVSHASKGYGLLLDRPRFVDVKQNTISECQGGVQVRGEGATGKITNNDLQGLSLYVQHSAAATMLVGQNSNVMSDGAAGGHPKYDE